MPLTFIDGVRADANARTILRAATASHHQRVDEAFSAYTLSDPASYRRFLCAQAMAHLPVEDALAVGGIETVVPDWKERRRGELLRLDLVELGLDVPRAASRPSFFGKAALLGALYVLEGSRLGGTLLRRSVADGLPTRFLDEMNSAAWRDLLSLLDTELGTKVEFDSAIRAAGEVFDLFEAAGLMCSR